MTIYKRITEIKNTEIEITNISKPYSEAENRLVELFASQIKNAQVSCSTYGSGEVVNTFDNTIDNMFIDIAFGDITKSFSVKHIMTNTTSIKFTDPEIYNIWEAICQGVFAHFCIFFSGG
jgi:hypothetical protein